jgi:hypothetical protein
MGSAVNYNGGIRSTFEATNYKETAKTVNMQFRPINTPLATMNFT